VRFLDKKPSAVGMAQTNIIFQKALFLAGPAGSDYAVCHALCLQTEEQLNKS